MSGVTFTVPGPPRGKARPRVVRGRNGGIHAYTPEGTAAQERRVRAAYTAAGGGLHGGAYIRLEIMAGFPVPESAPKAKRAAMLAGEIRPAKKPDWDNIGKLVADALNGLAYRDDAQVVEAYVAKRYVEGGGETKVTVKEAE